MGVNPFRRLQTELAEMIADLPAESRLPSEPDLARRMGVSRATLREAMRSFEGQGLIRRRQGVGTFVMAKVPVIESGLEVLESIETLAKRTGMPVNMKDLQIEEDLCNEEEANQFNMPTGSPTMRISRVIYTDSRPIAFLVDTLPVALVPVEKFDNEFTGSVLDVLLQYGDPKLTLSRTDIKAVGATPEVARALQIQRDDVLLHFEARLYSEDGRVVDHSNSYFLPGYFHFHVVRRVG